MLANNVASVCTGLKEPYLLFSSSSLKNYDPLVVTVVDVN